MLALLRNRWIYFAYGKVLFNEHFGDLYVMFMDGNFVGEFWL